MGRPGTALLVAVLLSAHAFAEPERPCPACRHGMARAEGPVASAADYLCRFCEVAVHARPDGREAVSYRIAGERREFELLGDTRLSFPLPGFQTPDEVIVPVEEAALAAAPGAGHPVRLPGRPVNLPGHPMTLPAAPVNLPGHPVRLPSHPVELPAHPVELPGDPVELPDHPVRLPSHSVTLQSHPVRLSGAPVRLPGHPVGLPGHPIGIGGQLIVRAPVPAPVAPVAAVREPQATSQPEPSPEPERTGRNRFFGRPSLALRAR